GSFSQTTTLNIAGQRSRIGAVALDGVDDLVILPEDTRAQNEISVALWVRTTETTDESLFSTSGTLNNRIGVGYRFFMNSNGEVRFDGRASENAIGNFDDMQRNSGYSSTVINDGSWHYIVGTAQVGSNNTTQTWKIYVDGVEENTQTTISRGGVLRSVAPFNLGGDASRKLAGEIDQLAIWIDILTPTEIANIANGCIDLNDNDLIRLYSFDERTGTSSENLAGELPNQPANPASFAGVNLSNVWVDGQIFCPSTACASGNCPSSTDCTYEMSQKVIIGDPTPPVAVANALTTFNLPVSGSLTLDALLIDNGSSDNCTSPANLSFSVNPPELTCLDEGINTVQFSVTDEGGNTTTINADVEIVSAIQDQTVTLQGGSFCPDGTSGASVEVSGSQIGFDYSLIDSNDQSLLAGPIAGTGGAITLATGNLSSSKSAFVEVEGGTIQGSAIEFDGIDDRILAGTDFRDIGTQVTIAMWVKTTSITGETLIQKLNGNTGFRLFMNTNGEVRLDGRSGSNTSANATLKSTPYSTTRINDGQWHYVVGRARLGSRGSFDEWTISVDGVVEGTSAPFNPNTGVLNPSFFGGAELEIGGDINRDFDGTIDDVIIFASYLTDTEVSDLFSSQCDVLDTYSAAVVALFRLDENQGTTIKDESRFALDGTSNIDPSTAWVAGNTACQSCSKMIGSTLVLGDNSPPVIETQNVTLSLDTDGEATINAVDLDNGSTDDCSTSLIFSFANGIPTSTFTCANLGVNNLTLFVSDGVNESSTSVSVTIVDDSSPSISASDNFQILDNNGNLILSPTAIGATAADNCDSNPSISLSKTSFSCADLGDNTVTVTSTDASGNQNTRDIIVTILDQTDPIAVGQNITVQLDANGQARISPEDVNIGSSDACTASSDLNLSIRLAAIVASPNNPLSESDLILTCDDLGSNDVELRVEDASGNIGSTIITVTVEDSIEPIVVTQDIVVELNDLGNASIVPSDVDNGSSDNCTFTLSLDRSTFTTADLGENAVTLTATDSEGNISSLTARVTVTEARSSQMITFSVLPDVSYGIAPIALNATASSGLNVSYRLISGPAALSGNLLTITGTGTVEVEANQPGNIDFGPADAITREFIVSKASLTAKADNFTITSEETLPTLTFSYAGFVNGEDETVLDESPIITSNAIVGQPGNYPVTLSGGSDDNYDFTLVNGTIAITKVLGLDDSDIIIYPNPVISEIRIESKSIQSMKILDMDGRILSSGSGNSLDVSGLSSGTYIVQVIEKSGTVLIQQIIKK
ncbi:MAG: LamG-like jellyroll fold domain-containing protein, partial [Bacteroidota bacterium]